MKKKELNNFWKEPPKPKPLSREFLLNRGKCCNSGCKNCPYYEVNDK